jgi:hypothetical protein
MKKETFVVVGGVVLFAFFFVTRQVADPLVARSIAKQEEYSKSKENEQKASIDSVKSTKAYARGYAAGKLWAEVNDVPDKSQKQYYQQLIVLNFSRENRGQAVPGEEIQGWDRYAHGWADAVFGED